ncbi:hypothetical protein GBO86_02535 [Pediococcus acidilactici]|nr:hypothetical protein GBO86_02535 [Pediococcus acidilactici]UWF33046.1 hypothetical protein NYR25_05425 [Pediococcus acidilactici]
MKKQSIDERVRQVRNQIAYETLNILLAFLVSAIAVQMTFFDLPWSSYVVEAVGLGLVGLYATVRTLFSGISLFGGRYEKSFLLLFTVGLTCLNAYRNYHQYRQFYQGNHVGVFIAMIGILFLSSLCCVFLVMGVLKKFDAWNLQRIERRFDKDK